ncbi:hypothetical protein AQ750_23740 [Burkholderia pseudomallei]|nr:hypothetical protein AQ750_23740 [Burkholderia pseudomallei]
MAAGGGGGGAGGGGPAPAARATPAARVAAGRYAAVRRRVFANPRSGRCAGFTDMFAPFIA